MDVRCERCRAQYVFDDDQVTSSGLTVQCTNCGHVFRVKKKELVVTVAVKPEELERPPVPASAAAPRPAGGPAAPARAQPEAREWRIRHARGEVFAFRELTTLQKWIVEGKVSREDELALAGGPWRRLGDIGELGSFFEVVEAAERARRMPPPAPFPPPPVAAPAHAPRPPPPRPAAPAAVAAPPPAGPARPAPAAPPLPSVDVELGPDDLRSPRRRGRAGVAAALVLLLALGAGGAAYRYGPWPFGAAVAAPAPPAALAASPDPAPPATPPEAAVAEGAPSAAAADGPPAAPAGDPAASAPVPGAEGGGAEAPAPAPEVAQAAEPPPHVAPPELLPAPAGAVAAVQPDVTALTPPPPPAPRALVAQASRLRERGEIDRALALFGRALEAEPGNVAALTGRGLCYLDLERYPPAEASFRAALRVRPDEADALLGLAETYRWQGKRADAIRYYERYLAAHPAGEEANVARNALEELRN